MESITYRAIGLIRSPFTDPQGTPIQPPAAAGVRGSVELDPEYTDGLKDLDGFSHIILIYHFHRSKPSPLHVRPFMHADTHGVFAIRGSSRPNSIGLSIVRLLKIDANHLTIQDVDILDGTPLLDIKPYVPQFDVRDLVDVRIGWLGENVRKLSGSRDDGRFAQ